MTAAAAVSAGASAVGPLGLIAGGGFMPLRVADAAHRAGRGVFVVLIEGFGDPAEWADYPHTVVRVGAVGQLLGALRQAGVRQVVMSGRVTRPSLLSLRLDGEGMRLAARLGKRLLFGGGDDRLLKGIVQVMREEGFEPMGSQEVFSELLMPAGCPTRVQPYEDAAHDIRRGIAVARQLGAVDTGQGCVVQQGLVLAVEAIEGTDAMIARSAGLRREGPGGVLVKLVKPAQTVLLDLPVIGPATVRAAAAAGLRGIAVEALHDRQIGTIVIDRDVTISEADAAGLFLVAIDADRYLKEDDVP